MSQAVVLKAEPKQSTGKETSKALRKAGKTPAIIYGKGSKNIQITLDSKLLTQLYLQGSFTSKILDLNLEDKTYKVIPQAVQLDPLSDLPIHADFLRIPDDGTIAIDVNVHFINQDKSPGIKRGGVLNIVRRKIRLYCPVDHIPEAVTVDLQGRHIGESIHLSHIQLPKDVRPVIADRDFTIATIAGRGGKADDTEEATTESAGGEGNKTS